MDWTVIGAAGTLGLFGGAHCAGMCGGFALLVAKRGVTTSGRVAALTSYCLGKAATYSILVASIVLLVGGTGNWLESAGASNGAMSILHKGLTATCAAVLVVGAFASFGVRLRSARRLSSVFASLVRPIYSATRRLPGMSGAFGAGACTGLLPCGLSWSAFALLSGSDFASASIGALAFGLATAPALLLVGLVGRRLESSGRAARWVLGTLLLASAGVTLARADWGGTREALPDCCSDPVHAAD